MTLDENDSVCHSHLAWIHLNRRSFDLAEQHYRHAIELNPNYPNPLHGMGFLLIFSGKPDEGIPWLTKAKRLDPYFDSARHWRTLGLAHFVARRYDEAISAFSRSSTIPVWVQAYLAACYAMMEQDDRAKECTAESLAWSQTFRGLDLQRKSRTDTVLTGSIYSKACARLGCPSDDWHPPFGASPVVAQLRSAGQQGARLVCRAKLTCRGHSQFGCS